VIRRPPERFDAVVVGGGLTGCLTALRLAQAGAAVALVEQYDIGTQASGRNAGSLHGQIQHEPFVTEGEGWAREWAPCLDLLKDAIAGWHALSDELGVDLEVRTKGGLLVADDPAQMPAIERKVALEREHGIDSQVLGRDELLALAPYLDERVVGGELCPIEGKASPILAAPAIARAAAGAGADLRRHTPVRALERDGDGFVVTTGRGRLAARRVVVAAGADTPRVTRMLGVDLPIEGPPMQVNVTEPVEPLVGHLVYYAGGRLTLKQAAAGSLLVGGGWPARTHPVTGRPTVDLEGMRRNLAIARSVVPAIGGARLLRTWWGVNNATPDQRPIVGPIDGVDGLVVGTFPFLGFTAAPVMGDLLATLALGRTPERDLEPFSPGRF